MIDILLPLALAFIMFSLGLGLVPGDFLRVVTHPKAIGIGLLGQVLLMPLLGFSVALGFGLPPLLAAGTVLLAACPGGVSSGLLTRLAGGDVALSISLTALSSLLALITLPLISELTLSYFLAQQTAVNIPVLGMIRGIFILTTVPVATGLALRHWQAERVRRFEPFAGRIATGFFVLIVIATFINQRESILANLGQIGAAMMVLNVAVMTLGFVLAGVTELSRPGRIAVAMECGLQNAALGIFVATVVLREPGLAAPSVVYALLMNAGAIGAVFFWRRRISL